MKTINLHGMPCVLLFSRKQIGRLQHMINKKEESEVFRTMEDRLISDGYRLERKDFDRPWGGFFVIAEEDKMRFISQYFSDLSGYNIDSSLKISPKILLVAPEKRLSWQYHHRRSEIWQVVDGEVGIIKSKTNKQTPLQKYVSGEQIQLNQGDRHRLIGLDDWGIVAEIWIHTDPNNPSDESDIVRIEDDFNRD